MTDAERIPVDHRLAVAQWERYVPMLEAMTAILEGRFADAERAARESEAVSLAMGTNWLAMAALGRSVTGLSWSRFVRSQAPGAALAALLGIVVALTVHGARSVHLGSIPVLAIGVLTALVLAAVVMWSRSLPLLGTHGIWASRQAEQLLRRLSAGRGRRDADALAEVNPK